MKKTSIISTISAIVIIASLIGSLWLDESLGSRIVNVVTVITGIIGAVALFVQFRKDKQINTANFLMNYGTSFYDEYNLMDIFSELNKVNTDPTYKFDFEKYRTKIIVYLEWAESIASLVERKAIDLYTIDNFLSYKFFLIVNNKQVQDNELVPFSEYYRGCYYLYDVWSKYEEKRGLKMPLEATALHLSKDYQKKLEEVTKKIKVK